MAALLRANGIPAGFCYQRLSVDDTGAPYSLHGFNAIRLPGFGWYRVDSRGNRPGVDAEFHPPIEQLAFKINFPADRDFGEILPDPLEVVSEIFQVGRTAPPSPGLGPAEVASRNGNNPTHIALFLSAAASFPRSIRHLAQNSLSRIIPHTYAEAGNGTCGVFPIFSPAISISTEIGCNGGLIKIMAGRDVHPSHSASTALCVEW